MLMLAKRSFAEEDLKSIVTAGDAPPGTALVAAGAQSLDDVAEDIGIGPAMLSEAGFVTARSAVFTGPEEGVADPDFASEGVLLFSEARGARRILSKQREQMQAAVEAEELRELESRELGEDGFGVAVIDIADPASPDLGHAWYWRRGNLVLVAGAAAPQQAEEFARALDRRAARAG